MEENRGGLKNTRPRTVESGLKTLNYTWGNIQKLPQNRQECMIFAAVLCSSMHEGSKYLRDAVGLNKTKIGKNKKKSKGMRRRQKMRKKKKEKEKKGDGGRGRKRRKRRRRKI